MDEEITSVESFQVDPLDAMKVIVIKHAPGVTKDVEQTLAEGFADVVRRTLDLGPNAMLNVVFLYQTIDIVEGGEV